MGATDILIIFIQIVRGILFFCMYEFLEILLYR